jgi:hypothetical protein
MKKLKKLLILFLIINLFSCNDEPFEDIKVTTHELFSVSSKLYNNIERITDNNPENNLVCIDFIYAFRVDVYDEDLEYTYYQIMGSDLEFSAFLGNLPENFSISMSYPITSTTDDGLTIEINTNDELKAVIDSCLKEEIIGYCNGLLTQPQCVWKVIHNDDDDANNDFEDAYFDVDNFGETAFSFEDTIYNGTWISFFIEDELHLNINLNDDTTVGENWNFDWKTTIVDENNMTLENDDTTFYIQKECEIDDICIEFEFEECELNEDEGIAEFPLEDYMECITNFIEYETSENTVITFHETLNNAENNSNPILTPFLNTANPQFIQVRIENSETAEVVYTSIKLTAINCE